MRRFFFLAVASTLAACGGDVPLAGVRSPGAAVPTRDITWGGDQSIFTSEYPASTLDATGGWEVGTQFTVSDTGRVVGFRWWKAEGETGSHTARLWNPSGFELANVTFSNESSSGWQTVTFSCPCPLLTPGNSYVVSVNTNEKQVKSFGYLLDNPITNGSLTADFSYYGQPTGSQPTSGSYSIFFVDVIFQSMQRS